MIRDRMHQPEEHLGGLAEPGRLLFAEAQEQPHGRRGRAALLSLVTLLTVVGSNCGGKVRQDHDETLPPATGGQAALPGSGGAIQEPATTGGAGLGGEHQLEPEPPSRDVPSCWEYLDVEQETRRRLCTAGCEDLYANTGCSRDSCVLECERETTDLAEECAQALSANVYQQDSGSLCSSHEILGFPDFRSELASTCEATIQCWDILYETFERPRDEGQRPQSAVALPVTIGLQGYVHGQYKEGDAVVVCLPDTPSHSCHRLSESGEPLETFDAPVLFYASVLWAFESGRPVVTGSEGIWLLSEQRMWQKVADPPATSFALRRNELVGVAGGTLYSLSDGDTTIKEFTLEQQEGQAIALPTGGYWVVGPGSQAVLTLCRYGLSGDELELVGCRDHAGLSYQAGHPLDGDDNGFFYFAYGLLLRFDWDGQLIFEREILDPSAYTVSSLGRTFLRADGQGNAYVALTVDPYGKPHGDFAPSRIDPECSPHGCAAAALLRFDAQGELQWSHFHRSETSRAVSLALLPAPSLLLELRDRSQSIEWLTFEPAP